MAAGPPASRNRQWADDRRVVVAVAGEPVVNEYSPILFVTALRLCSKRIT